MLTREDLCSGFVAGRTGSGRCCCGLHWTETMPPHTADGVELSERVFSRIERRERAGVEAEARRLEIISEDVRAGRRSVR